MGNPPSREPVDRLAEEFVARYRRGEWPQISEYLERHPELEAEIRAVFPPLILMERAALAGPSSSEPDRIGPYRTIRLLGAGGQGQVFLAEDTRLKRRVALKVLAAADPAGQMLARFRREAAVTAKLDHPGICTVYEAGEDRGAAYIAMRYVEGETLAQEIAAGQKGDDTSSATREGIARLVAIVEKAARALHVAHEAGLVHRDIKPGNVMITPSGDPVILDFGLARDIGDEEPALTRTGMRMGTPVYMSPEQIAAERLRVDHRTDIYSLGVTLYECLTLRRPFEAATWDQLYHQILSAEPEAPRRRNPMVPPDLQIVLSTAMEKDRGRRYQTALDFAEDLRRVRELEPIRARPAGALLRLRRWAQRNPAVAASVAATFLALLVGLVVSAKLLGETRRERDAKAEALGRAGGLGLAAQALAIVEEDPGLALSLAVEAARRAPGPQANGALLRALELNRERRRFKLGHANRPAVAFAPDGRRIATNAHRTGLLDIDTGEARDVFGLSNAAALSFDPGGTRILAVPWGPGGAVEVFDTRTGLRLASMKVPPGEASRLDSAAFASPDWRRVATRGRDCVHVWDLETGRLLRRLEGVHGAAFSPDGRSLVAWGASGAVLWSEGESRTVVEGSVLTATWDAHGPRLAVVAGTEVRIVDALTGTDVGGLRGHEKEVACAWWSPDGARLFTTSLDGTGRLWDLARGAPIGVYDLRRLLGHREATGAFDAAKADWGPRALFSADGRRIVAYDRKRAFLVDAVRGAVYGRLVGHQGWILDAAFSPDGNTVATVSEDGTARIWNAAPGLPVVTAQAADEMLDSVAISPDGLRAVTAAGPVRLWDARTGEPVAGVPASNVFAALFSPSGRLFFTVSARESARGPSSPDWGVRFWEAATGKEWPPPADAFARPLAEVVWTPDGRLLAGLFEEEAQKPEIVVVEIDSGAVVARIALDPAGDGEGASLVTFGADGRMLVTHSPEGGLAVRDLVEGRVVAALPIDEAPGTARVTPDGQWLLEERGETLGVWHIPDLVEAELRGHTDWIVSLDLSPDGRFAVTASIDGTARVWDIALRRAVYTLAPGAGPLNLAKIGPDGRHIVTVASDGDARLWDFATGDLVAHLALSEGREMFRGWYDADFLAAFSGDGGRVATSAWDGVLRIWPVDPLAAALAGPARELTPEERAEFLEPLDEGFQVRRDARRRVDALFHELLLKEDVLARLRSEPGLAPDVRAAALEIAGARETDRGEADLVAWSIVEDARRPEAEQRRALRVAEALLRDARGMETSDGRVLLAAALCRVGEHRAAMDALGQVDEGTRSTGQYLAVRALLLARAGRAEEARADLGRAREAPDLDSSGSALAAEAEALLGAK